MFTLGLLWAVLASMAATMALGMLWYGPLFGKPWMKAMGWDAFTPEQLEEKRRSGGPGYAVSLATTAFAVVLLWVLFGWTAAAPEAYAPSMKGMVLGLTAFLAFYVPGTLTGAFFTETKLSLWAIGAGFFAVLAMVWGLFVGIFY